MKRVKQELRTRKLCTSVSILALIILFITGHKTKAQTIILSEEFNENALPLGWDTLGHGNSWAFEDGSEFNILFSHYMAFPFHGMIAGINEGDLDKDFSNEYLISPSIDLTSYSSAYISLDMYFLERSYQDQTATVTIEASVNNGNTWDVIKNIEGYYNWRTEYIDVSAYTSYSEVKFAIHYSDNSNWMYGMAIDNFKLCSGVQYDCKVSFVEAQDYVLLNSPFEIRGELQNLGGEAISFMTINWAVDDGDTHTYLLSSLNVQPMEEIAFVHPEQWIPEIKGSHVLKVWATDINGNHDQNTMNDTAVIEIENTVTEVPEKKVLVEMFEFTDCSICTHGAEILNYIADSIENAIGVIFHDYVNTPHGIYKTLQFNYEYWLELFQYHNVAWWSTGMVDRYRFVEEYAGELDRKIMKQRSFERVDHISPVSVDASYNYNSDNRVVTIDVEATFFCNMTGDYRFNCYLVQDSIIAEQTNYFANPDRFPFCGDSSQYQAYNHMHVIADPLGGYHGVEGSLPENIEENTRYEFQFVDTLYEGLDENNLSIIIFVQKFDEDENSVILNALELPFDNTIGGTGFNGGDAIIIYPNPVKDIMHIDVNKGEQIKQISIYNQLGQVVVVNDNVNKTVQLPCLKPGIYIVEIKTDKGVYVQKLYKR